MSETLRRALIYRAQFPFCARPVRKAQWVLDGASKKLLLAHGIRKSFLLHENPSPARTQPNVDPT